MRKNFIVTVILLMSTYITLSAQSIPDFSTIPAKLHSTTNMDEMASQYQLNKAQWDAAINWLKSTDLKTIKKGKYKINDELNAIVQDSQNKPLEQCKTESHYFHVDLHYVVNGTEGFALLDHETSVENCKWKADIIHYDYDRSKANYINGEAGTMLVFFPSDWHIAKVQTDNADQKFRTIIIKLMYIEE